MLDRTHGTPADDAALDPAASLALLRAEQARASRAFDVDARLLYTGWGLAWLVGFTAFALCSGPDPVLGVPPVVPGLVLLLGLLGAAATTAVHVTRTQRGLSGPGARAGTMYGVSWPIGFVALSLMINGAALVLGDDRLHTVLWPAGSGLVVGLMYLMGGTLWQDTTQYALGAWVAVLSGAAVFLGLPGQHWAMALGGGAAFLVAAALEHRSRARSAAVTPAAGAAAASAPVLPSAP